MNSKSKKILVVATKWPSKEHPYLVHLYSHLKQEFPGLSFFLLNKGDYEWGVQMLGKRKVDEVLEGVKYRPRISFNPFHFVPVLLSCLWKFNAAFRLYTHARKEGYKRHQAIGQCYFYHAILNKQYDLVYFNALQIARHFSIRGVFPKLNLIASSRGQDFDLDPQGYDYILTQLEALHVLGSYLKTKAVEKGFSKQIFQIAPAFPELDGAPVKTAGRSPDKIIIATAARLFWTKGHEYALRAVRELKNSSPVPVEYWVFGDGPEREKLFFMAKQLGIERETRFMGWKNEKEVVDMLMKVDFYLLLSLEEGFNNSVILAQSLGIPCIVSDAGGLPENVEHGVSGYVVPRYTVEPAVRYILQLAADGDMYQQMCSNARKRVQDEFSLKRQVALYSSFFKSALVRQ